MRLFFLIIFFLGSAYALNAGEIQYKSKICQLITSGNIEEVRKVLKKNRKIIDTKDVFNTTPLQVAVLQNDINIVRLILENKPNINAQDIGGAGAIHIATRINSDLVLEELIKAGVNINLQDNEGYTPAMRAIANGNGKALNILLKAKPDCYIKNKSGENINAIDKSKLDKGSRKLLNEYLESC